MARWWLLILTFGAEGRVEKALKRHSEVLYRARIDAQSLERRRQEAQRVLKKLVREKKACLPVLARVQGLWSWLLQ
ncbi:MAG TPA: hypothetical protein PLP42_15630 [Acidobacteriota bacterium]|nr:hypothetical protein [Acidobacteriota bacterium]